MAISQYYVDYGAGSDATGDGTIGTPWKTIQKALDTITRNSTDGDQINVKAGTAQVLGASLTLATYGTPKESAQLVLRGYTSAANDGGMGEIDCGGYTMWAAKTYDYIMLIDLECHTFGDNNGIALDDYITIFHCEVHKGASTPSWKYLITLTGPSMHNVTGCYVHDPGDGNSRCISANTVGGRIYGNYVVCDTLMDAGCGIYATYAMTSNNIVVCKGTGQIGIYAFGGGSNQTNNIVYNTTAGTGSGIFVYLGGRNQICLNNIVVGWSGAGGEGIGASADFFGGYNAFYNNTSNYTIAGVNYLDLTANDVALAADPFTDAANGDFSLTAAAKTALAAKGFPLAYLGAHANTVPNLNIGPIQLAASSGGGGGGGGFPILGGSVVR